MTAASDLSGAHTRVVIDESERFALRRAQVAADRANRERAEAYRRPVKPVGAA